MMTVQNEKGNSQFRFRHLIKDAIAVPRKTRYTKVELEKFRTILLARCEDARQELKEYQDASMVQDSLSPFDASEERSMNFLECSIISLRREQTVAMMNRHLRFLHCLDAALTRIDDGSYGNCIHCRNLIQKERLEVVPHTRMCLACKEHHN